MSLLLLATAVTVGALLTIQASVNPRLGAAVGSPWGGATVQLWLAFALLSLAVLVSGSLTALPLLAHATPWHLLGGIASPLYITSGILLVPRLGALTTGGLIVAGQVLGSVILDGFGVLGLDRRPLTIGLALGPAVVLLGVVLALRAQGTTGSGATDAAAAASRPCRAGWTLLGLLAGAALPVQGAVNAQLRADVDEPLLAAWFSFLVAAATITIAITALRAFRPPAALRLSGVRGMPWWGWLGALAAAIYVTATFLVLPELGAATTILLTVTGQQSAAALVDAHGAFGLPRRPLTGWRALAIALLIAGSAIIELL